MKTRHTVFFSILYFLMGIKEMAGEKIFEISGNPWLLFVAKPLLMPVLIAWMLDNKTIANTRFHRFVLISLFFSMGGDILLMFKNDDLFIFGLASFLIAHVLYILAFAGNLKTTHTKVPATKRLLIALPFAAFVVIFLFILKGYMLGNAETAPLFIPVAVYASVIGLMGIFAAFRRNATNAESFRLIFTGALLFICSDTMIGVNRFITPVPQASLLIMGTYITAQYLIVKGTLCHTSLPR